MVFLNQISTRLNPLSPKSTKWSSTLKEFAGKLLLDHFVWLALKELRNSNNVIHMKESMKEYLCNPDSVEWQLNFVRRTRTN